MRFASLLLLLAALLSATALSAQNIKSAHPIHQSTNPPVNQTRAVVIGISDYQDAAIPDLRFADRDAEAFANFLRSPGGGSLNGDHLKVLINDQATVAQIGITLGWLMDESKPGDQAIIYFSGHGDVEAKLLNQLGFLLLWDSPAHAYLTGALAVDMLRQVVSTLSINRKAKVFVVVDACRAGKLADNTVIGPQLTGSELTQQFGQEQKVLSCQPNEFSIEGEQWDGGRGVFSYHLCNGLYGLADGDRDGQVTLFEIGRYLEDRVPKEVSPLSQMPLTVGDKWGLLFPVDGPTLAVLEKQGAPPVSIARVEQRGMLQEVLAKADSTIRFWYAGFERTLRERHFFEPAGDCAEYYFQHLSASKNMEVLRPTLTRNYAAALQDDAQQVLNIIIRGGLTKDILNGIPASVLYRLHPEYLARAAELLEPNHYMYKSLMAKRLYFKGVLEKDNIKARIALHEALEWQPDLTPVFLELISRYPKELADSAVYYSEKAKALSPSWILPYVFLARFYMKKLGEYAAAENQLTQAVQLDSNSAQVWYEWANLNGYRSNWDSCEYYLLKASSSLVRDICFPCLRSQLGTLYSNMGRFFEAEEQYDKAIELDSMLADALTGLASIYLVTNREKEAAQLLNKAIKLYNKMLEADSTEFIIWSALSRVYTLKKEYSQAEKAMLSSLSINPDAFFVRRGLAYLYLTVMQKYDHSIDQFQEMIRLQPKSWEGWTGLGSAYCLKGDYKEAEISLQKAIALDSTIAQPRKHLGMVFYKARRPDEARQSFLKAVELDTTYAGAVLGLAYLSAEALAKADVPASVKASASKEALGYVEQAIGKGSTFEQLESDEDLAPLWVLPEWKTLMKKHFPDNVKD